ncbi:MAG: Gfo/Idh/MocA family oxidoreductase, partial [Kiritimatiellae bacterium]|nr:Gfo/Idh/MocA family oxidoreductase [Kiritimatiellia bacterium]
MTTCLHRRSFLKGSAAAAFTILPAHLLRAETAPSNQLTRALIGFGGIARSGNHLGYKATRLVALCDPDANRVKEGIAKAEQNGYGKIFTCRDFREILARPDVDIVHICTPPHWHGLISVMAAEAGKDIWCEKPMTRTIGEGRRVMEAVQANARIFRLNTWFRFQSNFYGMKTEVKP